MEFDYPWNDVPPVIRQYKKEHIPKQNYCELCGWTYKEGEDWGTSAICATCKAEPSWHKKFGIKDTSFGNGNKDGK